MPCYNAAQFLVPSIQSILTQTFLNMELIIIDDASSDDSGKIIDNFQKKDLRIRVFTNNQNKGISKSMNVGLKNARGEYITRMDSDDIVLPEKIAKQVDFLDNHADYDICSVDILGINKEGVPVTKPLYPPINVPINWLFLWKNPIPNAPTMYRKSALKGIYFDNELSVAEDYDFLCKLILNAKVHQINEVLYHYRIHQQSMFQKHAYFACKNTIIISRRLAENLSGVTPPEFHDSIISAGLITCSALRGNSKKYFQDLAQKLTSFTPLEVSVWMEKLLLEGKKRWNWSATEYEKTRIHAEKMLTNIFLPTDRQKSGKKKATSRINKISRKFLKNIKNLIWTSQVSQK